MSEKAEGGLSYEIDNDKVICPNCCHQFRAIPVNVQKALRSLSPEREAVIEEPFAWVVMCDKGSEFDYLIFSSLNEAEGESELHEEGGGEIIPLYRKAALKSSSPAGNEGMVSVPREPTEEMILAACAAVVPIASAEDIAKARKVAHTIMLHDGLQHGATVEVVAGTIATMLPFYRAMLAAALSGGRS